MTDQQKPTLGDQPIEPRYVEQMQALARGINEIFNGQLTGKDKKVGFVLLVFPFGSTDGRCNYISNGANREDIAILLREQAARFEEGEPEKEKRQRHESKAQPFSSGRDTEGPQ